MAERRESGHYMLLDPKHEEGEPVPQSPVYGQYGSRNYMPLQPKEESALGQEQLNEYDPNAFHSNVGERPYGRQPTYAVASQHEQPDDRTAAMQRAAAKEQEWRENYFKEQRTEAMKTAERKAESKMTSNKKKGHSYEDEANAKTNLVESYFQEEMKKKEDKKNKEAIKEMKKKEDKENKKAIKEMKKKEDKKNNKEMMKRRRANDERNRKQRERYENKIKDLPPEEQERKRRIREMRSANMRKTQERKRQELERRAEEAGAERQELERRAEEAGAEGQELEGRAEEAGAEGQELEQHWSDEQQYDDNSYYPGAFAIGGYSNYKDY